MLPHPRATTLINLNAHMKKIAYILAIWLLAIAQAKAEGDTLVLSLADAVHLARQQSPAAQSREVDSIQATKS